MGNDTSEESTNNKFNLRVAITKTRTFLDHVISSGRAHSPFADDKLKAADDAVSSVIHNGYQYVKKIAVNGNPTVILSVAGVVGALPSLPFGARATLRNAGLAVALASVLIYPDHLSSYFNSKVSATNASPK